MEHQLKRLNSLSKKTNDPVKRLRLLALATRLLREENLATKNKWRLLYQEHKKKEAKEKARFTFRKLWRYLFGY